MLTVIGGTYWEYCEEPFFDELWGSGLRGACALANKGFEIEFYSCLAKEDLSTATLACKTFGVSGSFTPISETVTWEYYHPLSRPKAFSEALQAERTKLPDVAAEVVLYYGLIEADVTVNANYLVYDPQNGVPYLQSGAIANHLALVLNKKEALQMSACPEDANLELVGNVLMKQTAAEVVLIKNGPDGGVVISKEGSLPFPVYNTAAVWPIGSGDIFSASFCWKWAIEGLNPREAAMCASLLTACYCERRLYPLPIELPRYEAISPKQKKSSVYLAGPFFNIAERWLINELRSLLTDFGNYVFSPLHDVGFVDLTDIKRSAESIAKQDLLALDQADVVLAVASGTDVGTIFEIGYAVAKGKRVIILGENVNPNDLTMLVGSRCIVTNDLSTAVYKASW